MLNGRVKERHLETFPICVYDERKKKTNPIEFSMDIIHKIPLAIVLLQHGLQK